MTVSVAAPNIKTDNITTMKTTLTTTIRALTTTEMTTITPTENVTSIKRHFNTLVSLPI